MTASKNKPKHPPEDKPTLREARLARTLEQRELARASGVSENTIYLIEHNRSKPRLATIRKLAAALDIQPRDIAWPGEPFA